MCWYCGCNMKLAARYAPVAAYVTCWKEIELVADALPARMKVSHLPGAAARPPRCRPTTSGA
jgi:oxygen-independent coproporphyrinogen III oxidase